MCATATLNWTILGGEWGRDNVYHDDDGELVFGTLVLASKESVFPWILILF